MMLLTLAFQGRTAGVDAPDPGHAAAMTSVFSVSVHQSIGHTRDDFPSY